MKANSNWKVLEAVRAAGLWIDAVSGNEVLRARRAGFPMGAKPPVVMLTADVLRDNALTAVLEHGVLPNVGSPGMIDELHGAGYTGPIARAREPGLRARPRPVVRHRRPVVEARHLARGARRSCARAPSPRSCPSPSCTHTSAPARASREFDENLRRFVEMMTPRLAEFPDVEAVNLGGGIPHPYRPGAPSYDLVGFRKLLVDVAAVLAKAAGRPIRVEIEPGRYPVAAAGLLVCRVKDSRRPSRTPRAPATASSWSTPASTISSALRCTARTTTSRSSAKARTRTPEPFVVAGPLCESGDVFTRDDKELLDPRPLPRPEVGDLLVLHDAGAYGAAMSSNYVSIGRVPQVFWDDGQATLVSRRETLDDVVRAECDERI